MSALTRIVAAIGLVLIGAAFLRLARSDSTGRVHLLALEYGVSISLVVAGIGLLVITAIPLVM